VALRRGKKVRPHPSGKLEKGKGGQIGESEPERRKNTRGRTLTPKGVNEK